MIMVGFFFEAYFLQCNSQNYIPYLCGFLLHPPFCSTITSEKSEFNFGCLLSSFFISHCNWKLLSRAQTQESFWVSNLKFPTRKLPFLKGKFSFYSYISKYKTGYSRLSFCSLNLKKMKLQMADISQSYPVYISAGAIEHTIYCMYFLQGHSPMLSHSLQQAKCLDVNKKKCWLFTKISFHNLHQILQKLEIQLRSPSWCRGERWTCNPRVSGWISGAGNMKKLLIWMKIHGLPQNHNKDARER